MNIIYAQESFPQSITKSIFLAGPTPRSEDSMSGWRVDALKLLEQMGFDGTVFIPVPRNGEWGGHAPENYSKQIEWEEQGLNQADCIVFWVPRDMQSLPAFTTNIEFGMWFDSGKIVFGAPPAAPKNDYMKYYCVKRKIPTAEFLQGTLENAIKMIGSGALRQGGECQVPLNVWKHKTFQSWLKTQKAAGNRLDGARVLWTFNVGNNITFAWSLHVDMFVTSENRHKINEFVIGRPDVAGIICFMPRHDIMSTEIILVREFRSPARTTDGMIHEIPCGSSKDSEEDTITLALHEVQEEVGFSPVATKLVKLGARQNSGTLSAHMSHIYSYELTEEEYAQIKIQIGIVKGVEEDSERTYVEIFSVRELLNTNLVDWATLGMVFAALKVNVV